MHIAARRITGVSISYHGVPTEPSLKEEGLSVDSEEMTTHPNQFTPRVCLPIASGTSTGFLPIIIAALEDILLNVWIEEDINNEINRIQSLTKSHLHPRQDRVDRGVDRLISFVEDRRSKFESELKDWPVKVSGGPRIPIHSVETCQLNGTFRTVWSANRLENVANHDKAQLQLTMNGGQVAFSKLGVVGQPEEPPRRFGGKERGRPERVRELNPTVTFHGVSEKTVNMLESS